MGANHEVFVAEEDGEIVGTYFLKATEGRRGARGQLRLRDGSRGTGTRISTDDVRPFDKTGESTWVSGDAV